MAENVTVFDATSGIIQATASMTIKNLSEVMTMYKPGKHFTSDSFKVGDTPMSIRVFPNGDCNGDACDSVGHVAIFLRNLGDADITGKVTFTTDARTWKKEVVVKPGEGWGLRRFLSHAQCTEAYKDKDFVVTVTVEIPGQNTKITGSNSEVSAKKFGVWEKVYTKMERTDFTLVFEGVGVACHKHILSAASPVFEAMVENQHLEAIESKANIQLSEEVGRAFVRFIYTGELEGNLLKEQATAFLELGNKYDVQELNDIAEGELLIQLDRKNMVEFISIGHTFNANKILEAALKMTKANMAWLRSQVL